MNNCCCSSVSNNINKGCPICKKQGQYVENNTVKNLVTSELLSGLKDTDFFICPNPKCDVVYFSNKGDQYKQKDVKVPIWFKEGANPKYICYCNKVTEEDIVRAVTLKGARTIKQLIEFTGAMKEGKCVTNNPVGRCCHEQVKHTFELALQKA